MWLFPGTIVKERIGERGARDVELEIEDVARIDALQSVGHAAPNVLEWSAIMRARGRTKLFGLYGVVPETREIRNFDVARGRWITPQDVRDDARVAFLGAVAAQRLFGARDPVGADAARRVARVPRDRRRRAEGRPARQHGRPGRQGRLHPGVDDAPLDHPRRAAEGA